MMILDDFVANSNSQMKIPKLLQKTIAGMRQSPCSSSNSSIIIRCAVLLLISQQVSAWANYNCDRKVARSQYGRVMSTAIHSRSSSQLEKDDCNLSESSRRRSTINRRDGIKHILQSSSAFTTSVIAILTQTQSTIQPAAAYTPDADPLRESLYLMSRVQEATVQQERFVNRSSQQDTLKSKMKLTLRLVEKNYRLLDQITFASEYITPVEGVVDATTAGYEAAEALQNAIDYVNSDLKSGDFEKGQKEYLTNNLTECRERLFDFMSFMPKAKLDDARKRVEEENVANRDEFDGDSDAGVYNPVVLPWKNR